VPFGPTAFEYHGSRACASIGNSWCAGCQHVSVSTALLWDVYLPTLILVAASFSANSAHFSLITRRQYQKTKSSYRERGSLKFHYIAQLHIYLLVIRGVLRWYSCGRHGCVRARITETCVVGFKWEVISFVQCNDYSVYIVIKMKYGVS